MSPLLRHRKASQCTVASVTNASPATRYTPYPNPDEVRQQAVKLYVDGMNYRRIERYLGLDHKSVMNWVKAHAAQLPDAPVPEGCQQR